MGRRRAESTSGQPRQAPSRIPLVRPETMTPNPYTEPDCPSPPPPPPFFSVISFYTFLPPKQPAPSRTFIILPHRTDTFAPHFTPNSNSKALNEVDAYVHPLARPLNLADHGTAPAPAGTSPCSIPQRMMDSTSSAKRPQLWFTIGCMIEPFHRPRRQLMCLMVL